MATTKPKDPSLEAIIKELELDEDVATAFLTTRDGLRLSKAVATEVFGDSVAPEVVISVYEIASASLVADEEEYDEEEGGEE